MKGSKNGTNAEEIYILRFNPEAMKIFSWYGWLHFFEKFEGLNANITL
jgi:hypothetical protein